VRAGTLPDRAWVLLRHGDLENRFDGDGSRIVGAVVLSAVNAGCNREWVRRLLKDPQHAGGFAALRRRRANLDRWLDREWDRAEALVDASPMIGDRHEAVYRATVLAEHIDQLGDWRGTGGATDRAVFLAVLSVAQRTGRLSDLALSSRELGELAKVTHRPAAKALHRLAGRGLLRRTALAKGTRPAVWQVTAMRHNLPTPHTPVPVGLVWGRDVAPTDTWRYKALGHATRRVYENLDDATSAAALAERLGVTRRTVERHFVKLAGVGLVERTPEGWGRTAVEPVELEAELGIAGTTAKQKATHAEEREKRTKALAAFAATESAPVVADPATGEVYHLDQLSRRREIVEVAA